MYILKLEEINEGHPRNAIELGVADQEKLLVVLSLLHSMITVTDFSSACQSIEKAIKAQA